MYLLVVVWLVLRSSIEANGENCPPWSVFNATSNSCECGSDLYGVVHCDSTTLDVSLQYCYCMTYSEHVNMTIVNFCVYTCHIAMSVQHLPIHTNRTSELNCLMCKRFNRTGVMCGECIAGYAVPVYSYSTACVECKNYKYNWLKYIAVAYLPLTLFYIVIVLLKISVNSAAMVVYVAISQIISTPHLIKWITQPLHRYTLGTVFMSINAVWNLDFFRGFYQPFCLYPDLSVLQVACLDYLVCVYPLVLILLTYCLVHLHDRYVVISKLWKPIYWSCSLLRKEWNIRESLIKAFSTFLILSYVKTFTVSVYILTFSRAWSVSGNTLKVFFLFMNGSIPYFGKEHAPYAGFAIFMLTVFNVLPFVLLCIYPCSCFQKFLNRTGRQYQLLHTFMDSLQGCFRERPWDCRYFAAVYLFLRAANLIFFAVSHISLYFCELAFLLVIMSALIVIFKPYKESKRNTIDAILLLIAVLFSVSFSFLSESVYVDPISAGHFVLKARGFFSVLAFSLPFYGMCLVFCQLLNFLSKVMKCNYKKLFFKKEGEPLLDPNADRSI